MRGILPAVVVLTLCALIAVPGALVADQSQDGVMKWSTVLPETKATPLFETLKSLVGTWEATAYYGGEQTVRLTYEVVSGGTVVKETYTAVGDEGYDMITMYHQDGDDMVATHYCSDFADQSRFRAKLDPEKPKTLTFELEDTSNVLLDRQPYMYLLELQFLDDDHFSQEWKWRSKGGLEGDASYVFTRKM